VKVLILGHKGMLGHTVHKYLSTKKDCESFTTNLRWPDDKFKVKIISLKHDYIVNCMGAIPQRTDNFKINYELPMWLDKFAIASRIIHPGTDCEMDKDEYGISKKRASDYLKKKGHSTKIIKTSIIGTELNTKASLLEWFLNSKEKHVYGYTEAYWNGNTSLQWAKTCYKIIKNYDKYDVENIVSTDCISKYELLNIIKRVYKKDIIISQNDAVKNNKCLNGKIDALNIEEQINEMKEFNEND
jgi:dTDP-4-dehydrorhamnose reductase|tara:strand:- start:62 stop:790 length:729 start_codon:yes stop_codon:yes gene_type:complete